MLIELLSGYSCLHPAVQVIFVNFQYLIHTGDVEAHPALQSGNMSFKGSSGAKRNNRFLVLNTDPHYLGHLFIAFHECNCFRRC